MTSTVLLDTIDRNKWKRSEDELTGTRHPADTSTQRKFHEGGNSAIDRMCDSLRSGDIVLANVGNETDEVVGSFR